LNYELDTNEQLRPVTTLSARPETITGDRADDWAVVDIDEPPAGIPPLPIQTSINSVAVGDQVYIIQHPFGGPKKFNLTLNKVTDVDDRTVRYLTTTTAGSSGAPVFNDRWQVVALHHAAGVGADGGSLIRNEGIRIERIVTALRRKGLLS